MDRPFETDTGKARDAESGVRAAAGTGAQAAVLGAISPRAETSVLVVGAGVSGCACAATLATAGFHVTLVNSAMDRVGLPAYGPDLVATEGASSRLEETMAMLPDPLAAVWLGSGMRPAGGDPTGPEAIMNIDRRRVSIETKRLLEHVPGVQFRQGFVVDLRMGANEGASARVEAETIFGELFEADVAVVAVGLSLSARTSVGGDVVEGGRYGEPASDGLFEALVALGARFREVFLEVGTRVSARDFDDLRETIGPMPTLERRLVGAIDVGNGRDWPDGYPPAPHLDAGLRLTRMLVAPRRGSEEGLGSDIWRPVVSPDGAATAEIYLAPGDTPAARAGAGEDGSPAVVVTRVPVTVSARVVTNVGENGRLSPIDDSPPVWVVGRSAGAVDYLESLASGVRGALEIAAVYGGGGDRA